MLRNLMIAGLPRKTTYRMNDDGCNLVAMDPAVVEHGLESFAVVCVLGAFGGAEDFQDVKTFALTEISTGFLLSVQTEVHKLILRGDPTVDHCPQLGGFGDFPLAPLGCPHCMALSVQY